MPRASAESLASFASLLALHPREFFPHGAIAAPFRSLLFQMMHVSP
ncbi:hypothetical protein ZMO1_ZMOp39x001 (plasmid) [Zymomonas mobilis subsp. mobilis ZM4 = ATCC 31821]|uniref:Uncharacterized protein n=1 Tax=Zymomonas mobilis subsp. mobilis (strain ATCC 31821 / ZM4 / CP4) TaxID=264203 RepID=Q8GF59_ZYMMO|nr:unknown [Zymomonas mobilis subsp. mobilis ZM4 = ATCC 31821]AVZ26905.1 hypothetical protein ZMO2_ZMOp39x001 [Zymomonas mobilis subsp. mobilis]AVZ28744.1 hypothetical protein ZMO3_ZMOp39x001 [Zymomonas mobilis subsp. mobilis]AVZ43237.1 hypothetical protein ZMO1_ZMOp39x001 [Zymomonas mobilis subsp. mobilis ZM4 = ATCC 31821]